MKPPEEMTDEELVSEIESYLGHLSSNEPSDFSTLDDYWMKERPVARQRAIAFVKTIRESGK